jgi:hypothetical protein
MMTPPSSRISGMPSGKASGCSDVHVEDLLGGIRNLETAVGVDAGVGGETSIAPAAGGLSTRCSS